MSWISVSFEVAAQDVEAISDALLESGAASVEVADADAGSAAERPVFAESGTGDPPFWRRSIVEALFAEGADAAGLIAGCCARAGLAVPPYRLRAVADQDWVRASREQFAPVRVSQRMWIVPSWHEAPDPGAVNIALDPGLAFGTGSHPTTRLCLGWLERTIRGGESVLDYGCGSGILAIAAMKLGAARVDAVDIDEQSLLAARANAIHNRVQVFFHGAGGAPARPAQIVVANILAHPLIVLAPLISRSAAPLGRLALAGLLTEQADEVRGAYERWFDFDAPAHDDGWTLLSATRRPS